MRWSRLRAACYICSLIAPCMSHAQTSEVSLGEAARRAREQKKPSAKPARVWTNDDLPPIPTVLNVVGAPPPSASAGEEAEAAPASDQTPTAAVGEEKARTEIEAMLAEAKEQLKVAQKELELVQRDFDLHRQQYYSNPGYASDTGGKARLDALHRETETKQQQVQRIQLRIAALEEQLKSLKPSGEPKPKEPAPAEK